MNKEEAIEVYNGLINTKIKEAFEFFAPELRKINEEESEEIDGLEEELEKEINKAMKSDLYPEEISNYDFRCIARHFAQWQKEQMMKGAVEGLICATITGANAISFLSPLPKELTVGDKVRVIVCKKED